MKKFEILLSESYGVVVEVEAETLEQAEEDAFGENAEEIKRYIVDSFVVESKEINERNR